MERIAIFRALYLGDMLCIIPTVRAIRHAYPQAEIFLIGLRWQKDFVSRFPAYFDQFIEFPGWPGLPEQALDGEQILAFLHHIRSHRFDLVLQMQGNGEITNSLCMLWNAKKVCGLRKENEYAPCEELFPVSPDGEHEILRFLKLVECLDIPRAGSQLEFPITSEENAIMSERLRQAGLQPDSYVCVHAGARDPRRRWPPENFAYVANHITETGAPVVLTGSGEEQVLLKTLQGNITRPVLNVVETFGHLTAGELAALIGYSRLLVSNDTGVSHLASATGTRSVIIFSPHSEFQRWRPLDTEKHIAIPCNEAQDRDYVLSKALEQLTHTGTFQPS